MQSFEKQNIAVFLPTRKGSERVKQKNTRPFANFSGGLLELKLRQLSCLDIVSEIILSTNDELSSDIGQILAKEDNRIKVIVRPDNLANSNTNLIDLVKYIPTICSAQHILWTHVTSPFTDSIVYQQAIEQYFLAIKSNYDSLMSVKAVQCFLWDKEANCITNKQTNIKWPRTQDLKMLYEVDSAIFLASRTVYMNEEDRIGKRPYLYLQEGHKSFDIDWEEEFKLAEVIYQYHVRKN